MAQPNDTFPDLRYFAAEEDSSYFGSQPHSHVGNESFSPWTHPGPRPSRNTQSPSRAAHNTIIASGAGYYDQRPGIHSGIQQPDARMDSHLQTHALLTVPNPARSRSAMSNISNVDHISSPPYNHFPAEFNMANPSDPSLQALPNIPGRSLSRSAVASAHMPNTRPNMSHGVNRGSEGADNASTPDDLYLRIYGGHHNEPWSAMRMTGHNEPGSGHSSFPQASMDFRTYRKTPASDLESVVGPTSDSGYVSYAHPTHSVISNDTERVDQDLPSSMFQLPNLNVNSAPSESTEVFPLQSDQASQYSGRSMSQSKNTYKCTQCKETSKCPSDFKKHMLKHNKPHTCDVSGCRRAAKGKGFTTVNDLQRHKKSVHRIGVERDSYQCASEHCRNRGKIWPRLDNFKQHITRMHKGEDEQELIRKSTYRQQPVPPTAVTSTDITLAGIGTEREVVGNELDDPVSGISLTPDQDTQAWISFDSSSHGFALDVDQMNSRESDQLFGTPNPIGGCKNGWQFGASVSTTNNNSRPSQDSLQMLADIASGQPSSKPPSLPSQRQLSSAPQTKADQQRLVTHAEQQRLALQKFGKALIAELQADASANGTDLENAVLRVLSGATQQTQKSSNAAISNSSTNGEAGDVIVDAGMTKTEALKASQAISNLIKQSRSSPFTSRSRRASKGFSSEKFQCKHCDVALSRACDMKKHLKRHTKPYGCTYPKCHKRFGAKSDWKRHENSQHFQLESFRCQLTNTSSQTPCGELFYRIELFKQHLQNEHKVVEETIIQDELRARRIGKNGQGQFWCGFCQTIVKLKEKRNAAWDERFDHIDKHFNKEKRNIEDWLCVEAKKTKGELLKQTDRTNFDEEDIDEDGECEPDDSPSAMADGNNDESYRFHTPPAITTSLPSTIPTSHEASRKRQYPTDDNVPAPAPKRRRTDVDRYCCSCKHGPWLTHMYVDCMVCNHHLCSNCPIDGGVGLDGGIMLG